MRTILLAAPVAIFLATAPAYADAQQHVQAAKKAERRGEWSKALEEWKKAYSSDVNAEYLIGIGDACAKLGNTAEAKKNYEAYLADPLALPSNVSKVKTKLASLDSAGGGLALPGAGGGLALPGAEPAGLALPGAEPAGLALPGSNAPPPLPVAEESGKKGKKGKKGAAAEAPALPGLDLPGAAPAQTAKAEPPGLELPGAAPALPLPGKKTDEKKVASASLDLPLPGAAPALPLPGPAAKPALPETRPAIAKADPPAHTSTQPPAAKKPPPVQLASTASPQPHTAEPRKVPDSAISQAPVPRPTADSGGASKTIAYITAGVALASLGGGAFALTKAGSAHSELTGSVHSAAAAQGLLEDEKRNRTLSFVGFAGGLVAAGLATALFAF